MLTELSRLRQRYRQQTGQIRLRAEMGTAAGVLYDRRRGDGWYFVRQRQAEGFGPAISVRMAPGVSLRIGPGVGVFLGAMPDGEWQIIGADHDAEVERGVDPGIHNGADPYAWGFLDQSMLVTLRCESLSGPVTGSLHVAVHSFFYERDGVLHLWNGGNINLAALVPGVAGQHRVVLVVLEHNDALGAYGSTAQALTTPFDLTDLQEARDAAPASSLKIWFWRMYAGMTEITQADSLMDAREVVDAGPLGTDAAPMDNQFLAWWAIFSR